MTDKECPICLESIKEKIYITTPCNHVYCSKCFMNLLDTKCPLCRKELKEYLSDKMLNSIFKNRSKELPTSNLNFHNLIDFPPLQ